MMVAECVPQRERTTGDSQISPSKKSMSLNQENRYARKIRRDGFHFHIRHYRILRRRNWDNNNKIYDSPTRQNDVHPIPGSANNKELQSTASPERQTETFSNLAMNVIVSFDDTDHTYRQDISPMIEC